MLQNLLSAAVVIGALRVKGFAGSLSHSLLFFSSRLLQLYSLYVFMVLTTLGDRVTRALRAQVRIQVPFHLFVTTNILTSKRNDAA